MAKTCCASIAHGGAPTFVCRSSERAENDDKAVAYEKNAFSRLPDQLVIIALSAVDELEGKRGHVRYIDRNAFNFWLEYFFLRR